MADENGIPVAAANRPADRRVIIHCDDMGMCQAANEAVRRLFTASPIRTGSVMVPCPWALDILRWLKAHPAPGEDQWDVGVHLTLTSEWATYRWRPLTTGSGLTDADGFLWATARAVAQNAQATGVRHELDAQLATFQRWGGVPTHLDTHMGTVFTTVAFLHAYLELAIDASLPAMLPLPTPELRAQYAGAGLPVDEIAALIRQAPGPKLQQLIQVPPTESLVAKKRIVARILESLPVGLSQVILHPAADTPELRAICPGWQQRVWDLEAFLDPAVYRRLDELGITLTTWAAEQTRRD